MVKNIKTFAIFSKQNAQDEEVTYLKGLCKWKKQKFAFHIERDHASKKTERIWAVEIVWYGVFYSTFTAAGSLIRILKNTGTHFTAQIKSGGTF